MREIRHIVIHHSASGKGTTVEDIDEWHRARGFSGIGYHYVIDGLANLVPCRDLSRMGAHAKHFNRQSIGVCVVGDNTSNQRNLHWNKKQQTMLRRTVDALTLLFPNAVVVGHRELAVTECPGYEIRDILEA